MILCLSTSHILKFYYSSEGDYYLDSDVGLTLLCSGRLPEDDTPVPKHVGVHICQELYDLYFIEPYEVLVDVLNVRICMVQ